MNRTRIIFFAIIGLAIAIIIGVVVWNQLNKQPGPDEPQATDETLEVQIVSALPVAEWVQEAAHQFNSENHTLEGRPIHVTVTPMDGLTAKGRYERDELDPLPTAWIPDSRYLVELVNAAYKERLGRDVFLTDGEYRARPLAISLLAWGIYDSRAGILEEKYGDISWDSIHDAAIAPGGWGELGGQNDWGFFKLAISNPRKNVSGLQAMVAAAGISIRMFGLGRGRMESVLFMGGQKTLTLSIILQVSLFPEYGLALGFCVLHHIIHLMMDSWLVGKLQKGKYESGRLGS